LRIGAWSWINLARLDEQNPFATKSATNGLTLSYASGIKHNWGTGGGPCRPIDDRSGRSAGRRTPTLAPKIEHQGHNKVDDKPGNQESQKFEEKALPMVEQLRNQERWQQRHRLRYQ
jgi:hypothetical protein